MKATALAILAASFLLAGAGHSAFAQYDDRLAVLETSQGQITIEFFPGDAPNHVANFVGLAESGFYDSTLFHRIIPKFMIQGGDPNTVIGDPSTWGTGGPGTSVAAEFNTIKHNRGIVSMARSLDPNSAGSQFFIVHQDSNFLDQQYTAFGRVVTQQGLETLDKIASVETGPGDVPADPEQARLIKASVVDRADVPDLLQLGEPERTAPLPDAGQNQLHENPDLGVVFSAPPGWLLQQPEKIDEASPDIVALGPQTGLIPPVIALTVSDIGERTFDEIIQEKNRDLEGAVSTGRLEIVSREESLVHGKEAFTTVAVGKFQTNDESYDVKFKEIVFYDSERFYVLVYSNSIGDFDAQLPSFEETVESFEILDGTAEPPPKDLGPGGTDGNGGDDGGGCLIATAAYGSEMAPQVQLLREIRDGKVMDTASGAAFMAGFNQLYYSFSPAVADLERQSPAFKEAVRLAITPMLASLSLLSHVEIDSEQDILGYGLAIIMLNVGMYLAAPALIIHRIRR